MNRDKNPHGFINRGNALFKKFRRIFAKKKCSAFNVLNSGEKTEFIEKIYVINLDRQPERFSRIQSEFSRITDINRNRLVKILERVPAVDAINLEHCMYKSNVGSKYTL